MESDYHWLVTVALVTSSIIAVTANAFLLLIFARRRGLRTIPNRFVINLLVTNLLSSILLIPLLVVDQDYAAQQIIKRGSTNTESNTTTTTTTIEENLLIKEEILSSNRSSFKLLQTSEEYVKTSFVSNNNNNNVSISNESDELLCYFAQASTSFVCTASIFSILLIGVNQYFGVIHSLRYHFYVNKCRATVFIVSSWGAASACAVLSTLTYSDGSLWHFCVQRAGESSGTKALNTTYALGYFLLVILAPFLAICIIYLCIYTAAHRNSERMRKSNSASSTTPLDAMREALEARRDERVSRNLPKVHSAPNFSALQNISAPREPLPLSGAVKRTSSDRNNFIVNLKHKISNASVFRYREETRAAKISVLVIFMVLVCYVPYGLTLVLASGCIRVSPGQIFNYLSLVLLVFSNVISPFLFGYRNKRVKREIGRMLGLVAPPKQVSAAPARAPSIVRNRSYGDDVHALAENAEPLIGGGGRGLAVPEVIVTGKVETERKSILKRVGSGWSSYKKCNFITVPDSCLSDARGSFSSASTQVSNDEF